MQPHRSRKTESQRFLDEADAALTRGSRHDALRSLDEARRVDPHNEELPLLAAMIQLELDDPGAAARLALEAIGIRPFHPEAHNVLGVACIEGGRCDVARRVLSRAVEQAPGLASAQRNLKDAKRRKRRNSADADLPVTEIERVLDRETTTLSVCLLLGEGQQATLQATLDSVRTVATDIVLIDRRSDSTELDLPADLDVFPERALAADAWEAASVGLRMSRSDWVLLLRGDEALDGDADAALEQGMNDGGALAHAVELRGPHERRYAVRLFRNAPGIGFHRPFGLDPLPSLLPLEEKWGLAVGQTELALVCRGETDDADDARTTDALFDDLEPFLEDEHVRPRVLIENARVEFDAGSAERALELAREARSLIESAPWRRRALELEPQIVLEGLCLMRLQRFTELAALMLGYHATYPVTATTLFLAGFAAKANGAPTLAAELLERALQYKERTAYASMPREVAGPGLPNLLGTAWIDQNELQSAREAFRLALEIDADNLDARLGLIAVDHAEGELEAVLVEFDRLVVSHGDHPKLWIAGGIVLGRDPRFAAPAVAWLSEAHRRFPENLELRHRLGEAQLQCGLADEALFTWQESPERCLAPAAARLAASLASGGDLPPLMPASDGALEQEVVAWFQRWMAWGAIQALDRALLDITRASTSLPGWGRGPRPGSTGSDSPRPRRGCVPGSSPLVPS